MKKTIAKILSRAPRGALVPDPGYEITSESDRVSMRVRGATLQELFSNALAGMAACFGPDVSADADQGERITRAIRAEAVDIHSLLVEFLSGVITRADECRVIFTRVAFREFGENFLEGELSGFPADSFDREIRGVSYDEVDIVKNPETGLFETAAVFEV